MAPKAVAKKNAEQPVQAQEAQQPQAEQAQGTWACDQFEVYNANLTDNGVELNVRFVSFIGTVVNMTVKRDDCFFNFPEVLRTMVRNGYRYNTLLPQVPALIQSRLTSFQPNPESVAKAFAEFHERQKLAQEKATEESKAANA